MAVAIAACPEQHYLRELHAFFISLDLPAAYVLCNAKLAREMLIGVGKRRRILAECFEIDLRSQDSVSG